VGISKALDFAIGDMIIRITGGGPWSPYLPMFFGGAAPLTLSVMTYGLAFIILLLIESIVIARIGDLKWRKAVWASVVVNITSIILGSLYSYVISVGWGCVFGIPIIIITGLWLHFYMRDARHSGWLKALVVIPLFLGYIGMVAAHQNPPVLDGEFMPFVRLIITYGLLMGFRIALALEVYPISFFVSDEKIAKTVIWGNISAFIVLAILAPFFWPNPLYFGPNKYVMQQSPELMMIYSTNSRLTTQELLRGGESSIHTIHRISRGIVEDVEASINFEEELRGPLDERELGPDDFPNLKRFIYNAINGGFVYGEDKAKLLAIRDRLGGVQEVEEKTTK